MFTKDTYKNSLENFSLQLALEHTIPNRDITNMVPYAMISLKYRHQNQLNLKKGGFID